MTQQRSKDPLHGITLEMMLERLVGLWGWNDLGRIIPVRCFNHDPSIKSSLTFLRKTPWARAKVEALYLEVLDQVQPQPDASDTPMPSQQRDDKRPKGS